MSATVPTPTPSSLNDETYVGRHRMSAARRRSDRTLVWRCRVCDTIFEERADAEGVVCSEARA